MTTRARRLAASLLILLLPAAFFPACWCGRDAGRWFRGDREMQMALARHVADETLGGISVKDFKTGSSLFDAEWAFGTYQMGALGLAQVIREHPEMRAELLPALEACLDRLLSPGLAEFDARSWGEHPLESLDGDKGHAAYLGYVNLALGLHRAIAPESRFRDLNDRISAALEHRLLASPIRILETYPGERYPVDNCAVLGSLAIHARLGGRDCPAVADALAAWDLYVDPASGLLYQAVDGSGKPADSPRASGTGLGAFFLSTGGLPLGRELHAAIRRSCGSGFLGFGMVREYPRGSAGSGDIDSGPVPFGIGFSATGFHLAGCRSAGDEAGFRALYRTAHLVGTPLDGGGRRNYVCGGPIGNAILLAMLTAPRP